MKKLITVVSSLLFVSIVSAKAEVGIGVTGAVHYLDASGTETTRQSNQKNKGSHNETVIVPEIFIESIADDGFAIGLSYIPVRDLDGKSRTDSETATGRDSGTYTAKAELENVIKVYTDIPAGSIAGFPTYVHLGVQHVTLATLESLNSGASYPNKDLLGASIGLGTRGDLPYGNNLYYKGEVTYTNFEKYKGDGAGNKVSADLQDLAAKFSIGYKF